MRAPSEAPTKDAKWITNVKAPTITIFRPAQEKNTGTAVIVCPGGGYWNLAWDLEGEEVAAAPAAEARPGFFKRLLAAILRIFGINKKSSSAED